MMYDTIIDPVISQPRSRLIAGAMYREAKRNGTTQQFIEDWLTIRDNWLAWKFRTQRKWQTNTRNPYKARHHDSIALREKYVRCA